MGRMFDFVFEHRETDATLHILAGTQALAWRVLKAIAKDWKVWKLNGGENNDRLS